MSCIKKITGGISYDCANKPKAGIESKAIILNREDLDITATTYNATNGNVVTNLSLKNGATAFSVDNLKQINVAGSSLVVGESGVNTHNHSFLGRVYNLDADGVQRIDELANANGVVVIVETKFKGDDNGAAFKVFGLNSGLIMTEGTYATNENEGTYLFTLASEEGYGEDKPMYIWNEDTYSATKVKFDALLGGA